MGYTRAWLRVKREKAKMTEAGRERLQQRVALGNGAQFVLIALTMAALTAIQEPIGWSWLAWVALVPWVVAMARGKSGRRAGILHYLLGLVYYLGNLYWLMGVTPLGYGALCFYMGWHFVLSGVIIRRACRMRGWSYTLVLPVVWVGQEYLRAIIFTGFPWLFLAHSQHEKLPLIQICDLCGAYGLTFVIAMVNGLVCDLLLRPLRRTDNAGLLRLRPLHAIGLTGCCVLAVVLYGNFRLAQGAKTIKAGPTVAVVQEVIPQYVKEQGDSSAAIFAKHLVLSEAALEAQVKPGLIVWPETMVTRPVNWEFLELQAEGFDLSEYTPLIEARIFDGQLQELAKQGAAVLVGTPTLTMARFGDELRPDRKGNGAVLYLPDGSKFDRYYDKMHLVPFGELVPFKESWPRLYQVLNSLTPYDYEYTLDAGTEATVFTYQQGAEPWRFAVAICYEDVMPAVVRRLAAAEPSKRVDFLLNISNDGWFVRGGKNNRPVIASTELLQHLVLCKFRAVENRLGIARAVNTGISAFIRPDGRVQGGGLSGTLADNPRLRQAQAGFLTDTVYVDSRVTFYNRGGDFFAIACVGLSTLLLLAAVAIGDKAKRARKRR